MLDGLIFSCLLFYADVKIKNANINVRNINPPIIDLTRGGNGSHISLPFLDSSDPSKLFIKHFIGCSLI